MERRVAALGIRLGFSPACGVIRGLTVTDQGRAIAPFHRAPWVGTGEPMPVGAAAHLSTLEGDFFCAPFGRSGMDGADLHGWPANGDWLVDPQNDPGSLHAMLTQRVAGARVTKTLRLQDGHPFLYQSHGFHGGAGDLPMANHAMISLPRGGLIRTSAKAMWRTPEAPPEADPARGRSALAYPHEAVDPRRFARADGSVADLTRYPFVENSEEFVVGIEAPGHRLGWSAVTRPVEGDLFLSLRDARVLPHTMLWHSNGGRDYAPWSGRHRACLGVEEGAAGAMLGPGVPGSVSLRPDGVVTIRHVTGAIAWPSGRAVASVTPTDDGLEVCGDGGAVRRVPFDRSFLEASE